jgi:hypothetical protein
MDECKNRAPGSLEWKDAMTNRNDFEKWAVSSGYDVEIVEGSYNAADTDAACEGYQSRQPEIDALKGNNTKLAFSYGAALLQCGQLEAENEKLRKAAERFINFFQDGVTSEPSIFEIMEFLQEHEDSLRAAITPPEVEPVFAAIDYKTQEYAYIRTSKRDVESWITLQHQSRDDVTYFLVELFTSPPSPKASWDADGNPLNLKAAARDALNLITEHNAKWKSKVIKSLREFLGES